MGYEHGWISENKCNTDHSVTRTVVVEVGGRRLVENEANDIPPSSICKVLVGCEENALKNTIPASLRRRLHEKGAWRKVSSWKESLNSL